MPRNKNTCLVCPDAKTAGPRVFSFYCQECFDALAAVRQRSRELVGRGSGHPTRPSDPPGHEERIAMLTALVEQGLPTPYNYSRRYPT